MVIVFFPCKVNSSYMEAKDSIKSKINNKALWNNSELIRLPHYNELNLDVTFSLNFKLTPSSKASFRNMKAS